MRKELDDKLVGTFPNLYSDRYGDMAHTCMCWGFPGDGWYDLIYEASEKIEKEILKQSVGDRHKLKAVQVKEKFGTLRFYMTMSNDVIDEAINAAEKKSTMTCEQCGAPGSLRGSNWLRTVCDACDGKR